MNHSLTNTWGRVLMNPSIFWCHGFLEEGETALQGQGEEFVLLGMEGAETKEKNKEGGETGPRKRTALHRVVKRTLSARNVKCGF